MLAGLAGLSSDVQAKAIEPPLPVDLSGIASAVQCQTAIQAAVEQAALDALIAQLETEILATDWETFRLTILETFDAPLLESISQPTPETAPSGLQSALAIGTFVSGFMSALAALAAGGAQAPVQMVAESFAQIAGGALNQAGVPEFQAVLVGSESLRATFLINQWALRFNPEYVQPKYLDQPANPEAPTQAPAIDPTYAADIAQSTFHEARHAEQLFLIARWVAGQQLLDPANTAQVPDPQAIVDKLCIPADVASLACADPIDPGVCEAAEATRIQAVMASLETNGEVTGETREAILALKEAREACMQALEVLKASPDDAVFAEAQAALEALLEAKDAVVPAYEAYLGQAHELDAREAAYRMDQVWAIAVQLGI